MWVHSANCLSAPAGAAAAVTALAAECPRDLVLYIPWQRSSGQNSRLSGFSSKNLKSTTSLPPSSSFSFPSPSSSDAAAEQIGTLPGRLIRFRIPTSSYEFMSLLDIDEQQLQEMLPPSVTFLPCTLQLVRKHIIRSLLASLHYFCSPTLPPILLLSPAYTLCTTSAPCTFTSDRLPTAAATAATGVSASDTTFLRAAKDAAPTTPLGAAADAVEISLATCDRSLSSDLAVVSRGTPLFDAAVDGAGAPSVGAVVPAFPGASSSSAAAIAAANSQAAVFYTFFIWKKFFFSPIDCEAAVAVGLQPSSPFDAAAAAAIAAAVCTAETLSNCCCACAARSALENGSSSTTGESGNWRENKCCMLGRKDTLERDDIALRESGVTFGDLTEDDEEYTEQAGNVQHCLREHFCKANPILSPSIPRPLSFALPICPRVAASRLLAFWSCLAQLQLPEDNAQQPFQPQQRQYERKAAVRGDQWWRRQQYVEASQDKCSSSSSIRLLQQLQQSFDSSMELLLRRQRHATQKLRLRQSCEMEEACGIRDKYAISPQKAGAVGSPASKSERPAAGTGVSHSAATTSAEGEGGHGKQEAASEDGRIALQNNQPAAGDRREVEVTTPAAGHCRHWTEGSTTQADEQSVAAGQAPATAHVRQSNHDTKRHSDSGTELSENFVRLVSDGCSEQGVSSRDNGDGTVAREVMWEEKPPIESLATPADATDVYVANSPSSSLEQSSSFSRAGSEQKHQHLTSTEQERPHAGDLQEKNEETHAQKNAFIAEDKVKALVLQHISELHLLELHWRGESTTLRRQHLRDLKNVAVDLLLLRQAAQEGLLAYPLVLPPLPSALESDLLELPAGKKDFSLLSWNKDASRSSIKTEVGFVAALTEQTEGTKRHLMETFCKERQLVNGSSTAASPTAIAASAAAAAGQMESAHSTMGAHTLKAVAAAFEPQQQLQQQSVSPATNRTGLESRTLKSTDKDGEVQRLLQQYLPKRSQQKLQQLPLRSKKVELLPGLSAFPPLLKKGQEVLLQGNSQNEKLSAAATATMKGDEHQQRENHGVSQHVVIQRDKAIPRKSKEQRLPTSFFSKLNASFPWHYGGTHCETAASSTPPIVDVERLLQPHAWQRMVCRWPEERLLRRLKQHAILPLIFGMQRKRSIVIRICSGVVTDICLHNDGSCHRMEKFENVETDNSLDGNKTDTFHNASSGCGSYTPTKSEQNVKAFSSRDAGDFQALTCSVGHDFSAATPVEYDYYPIEAGCGGDFSQRLIPQSIDSQDDFCSCLLENVERPEGRNSGCSRYTCSSIFEKTVYDDTFHSIEDSPLSLNNVRSLTREPIPSTTVAKRRHALFPIEQERRQSNGRNDEFSTASFVGGEENDQDSGPQSSCTFLVDGVSPLSDSSNYDFHPFVGARQPYVHSCFDFLRPSTEAAKPCLLAMLLPVGSSLQLRSPAHIQWENHISARTDFVFPSIQEQRRMLFGYLSEQQYYKHMLEKQMLGIRQKFDGYRPAEATQISSSTIAPEKSKSYGHHTFSDCSRSQVQSSTCSASHKDVDHSAATSEITHMSLGDFFVSRHSNCGGVHAVFHLIVRDDKKSADTETLHGASAGQAEICKEAPTIPDAVQRGLTEVLRVCCDGGVRTLVLPLLLLEDDVATYSLPSALLQRRLFQILRCLINELKALFQSNYTSPDLCQLVFVLPPVPKHNSLNQSACDTVKLADGSSTVAQPLPRKEVQEAVAAGTLAPGDRGWKMREDDRLRVCAEMGGTDRQQLPYLDKRERLFENCWTDMLLRSTMAFVRNCGHCCAANPEMPP